MNELQEWEAQCVDLVHLKDPYTTHEDDCVSQPTCGSSDGEVQEVPHVLPLFHTQSLWNRLGALPCPEVVDLRDVTGTEATRCLATLYVQTTPMPQLQLKPPVPLGILEQVACTMGALCAQTLCEYYGQPEDQLARRSFVPLTDAWGHSPYALRLTPSMGCMRCENARDRSNRVLLLPETVMFVVTAMPEMMARVVCVSPDSVQGTTPSPAMQEGVHDRGSTVSLFRLAQHAPEDTPWPSARVQFQCVLDMLWPPGRESVDEPVPPFSELWLDQLCDTFVKLYTALDFAGGNTGSDSLHLRQAMADAARVYRTTSYHCGECPCTITTLEVPIGLPAHMKDSRLYFVRLDCGRSFLLCYSCALHFTLPLFLPEVNTGQPLSATELCHLAYPRTKHKDPQWYRYNLRSLQAYDSNVKGNHVVELLDQTPDHWLIQMCSFYIHRPRANLPLDRLPLITQEVRSAVDFAVQYNVSPLNGGRKMFAIRRKIMMEAEEMVGMTGIFSGRNTPYVIESMNTLFTAPIVSFTRGECIEVEGLVVHEGDRPRKRQREPDTGTRSFSVTAKAADAHTTQALRQLAFSKLVFETLYSHYGSFAPAESW